MDILKTSKKLLALDYEIEVIINVRADKVFDYIAATWLEDAVKTSEGPTGVGSTFKWDSRGYQGMHVGHILEVTEYSPHTRLVGEHLEERGGPKYNHRYRHSYSFRPVARGTEIKYTHERLSTPSSEWLMLPALLPIILISAPLQRRAVRKTLEGIESIMAER